LVEEKILEKGVGLRAPFKPATYRGFLGGGERAEIPGPFPPRAASLILLERREERVSVEPSRLFPSESLETDPRKRGATLLAPPFPDLKEERKLTLMERSELHVAVRQLA
jgi:hypothetical protein